jgi:rfaE bifunctional protein kinase chain/domain
MHSLVDHWDQVGSPRLVVLGDLMLDRYTRGVADSLSTEVPVVVLSTESREVRLGGAASVARLLDALGAEVTMVGVVGDDGAGRQLQDLLKHSGADCRLIHIDPNRPTTTRERLIGRISDRTDRGAQQLLRVDSESREMLSPQLESELTADIGDLLDDQDGLVICDHGKGVCTFDLLSMAIYLARLIDVPCIVDAARVADYARYQRASLIKVDRYRAELATARKIRVPGDAVVAAKRLCRLHEIGAAVVTLGGEGMAVAQKENYEHVFPTDPGEFTDAAGAGDMATATLALCLASRVPLPIAVEIANTAAGLETEKIGIVPVTRDEISRKLEKYHFPGRDSPPRQALPSDNPSDEEHDSQANSQDADGSEDGVPPQFTAKRFQMPIDQGTVIHAVELIIRWAAAVAELHGQGLIHGNLVSDTLSARDDMPMPSADPDCYLGGALRREKTPLPLRQGGPFRLPREITAARSELEKLGLGFDPPLIDVFQLGSALCRQITGQSADAFLRSPRVKALLSDDVVTVLERSLISTRPDSFPDVAQFQAALAQLLPPSG